MKSEAFHADLERLKAGEPLAYLIGHTPFLNCQLRLDSHPLIPRTETEYWVEKSIESIQKDSKPDTKILDLCAGSGCIGVAVAKVVSDSHILFAEIDPNHLSTIRKNLEHNLPDYSKRKEYLKVVESNLFENVDDTFDFIFTNPPYIDPAVDRTEYSVNSYEPHLALYGGSEGLTVIDDIVSSAPKYLKEGGQLWIEHEPEQVEVIHSLAKKNNFSVATYKDQYDVERYSVLLLER